MGCGIWMEHGWVPESLASSSLPQLAPRVSPCVGVHLSTVPDIPGSRLYVGGVAWRLVDGGAGVCRRDCVCLPVRRPLAPGAGVTLEALCLSGL